MTKRRSTRIIHGQKSTVVGDDDSQPSATSSRRSSVNSSAPTQIQPVTPTTPGRSRGRPRKGGLSTSPPEEVLELSGEEPPHHEPIPKLIIKLPKPGIRSSPRVRRLSGTATDDSGEGPSEGPSEGTPVEPLKSEANYSSNKKAKKHHSNEPKGDPAKAASLTESDNQIKSENSQITATEPVNPSTELESTQSAFTASSEPKIERQSTESTISNSSSGGGGPLEESISPSSRPRKIPNRGSYLNSKDAYFATPVDLPRKRISRPSARLMEAMTVPILQTEVRAPSQAKRGRGHSTENFVKAVQPEEKPSLTAGSPGTGEKPLAKPVNQVSGSVSAQAVEKTTTPKQGFTVKAGNLIKTSPSVQKQQPQVGQTLKGNQTLKSNQSLLSPSKPKLSPSKAIHQIEAEQPQAPPPAPHRVAANSSQSILGPKRPFRPPQAPLESQQPDRRQQPIARPPLVSREGATATAKPRQLPPPPPAPPTTTTSHPPLNYTLKDPKNNTYLDVLETKSCLAIKRNFIAWVNDELRDVLQPYPADSLLPLYTLPNVVSTWSPLHVQTFISLLGYPQTGAYFRRQAVDGVSLLCLKQADLGTQATGLSRPEAARLFCFIARLHQNLHNVMKDRRDVAAAQTRRIQEKRAQIRRQREQVERRKAMRGNGGPQAPGNGTLQVKGTLLTAEPIEWNEFVQLEERLAHRGKSSFARKRTAERLLA